MGMGEPMDNLDDVLQAIRILSDQRGLDIAQSSITVSTVGHVDGIRRLSRLRRAEPPLRGFSRLRLAVSLNAPNDAIRSRIMPVNRPWPLAELKAALRNSPCPARAISCSWNTCSSPASTTPGSTPWRSPTTCGASRPASTSSPTTPATKAPTTAPSPPP